LLARENLDACACVAQEENIRQDSRARYARLAGIARQSESGLARRACLVRRARHALETLANVFSILLRPTQSS
jgi:phage tail tape-measure protein